MRIRLSTTMFVCLLSSNTPGSEPFTLADESDRINYTIGHQIGTDFKRQKILLDQLALRAGLQHGHTGTAPVLDRKAMNSALLALKRNITATMKQDTTTRINKRKQDEAQKRREGIAFMLENQSREGVKTLPSGLQYKVLSKGTGQKPRAEEQVTFNYRAKTLNGREYDSSLKKGKPSTYRANAILPGFTEAIQMMQPGAKWELYLPPELAYGRQGPLAHQTVIIEVELLSINKSDAAQQIKRAESAKE